MTAQASDASPTDVLKDTVTLKDVHEGGNATGMSDVVYDDDVMVPFPDGPSGTNSTGGLNVGVQSAVQRVATKVKGWGIATAFLLQ